MKEVRPGVPRIGARRPVKPALRPRTGQPHTRLRAATIIAVSVLMVVGGRLVQLQGLDATAYAAKGEAQRLRTTNLPAIRGEITDRWGKILSRNVETLRLAIDPTKVAQADKDAAASALAAGLGTPYATLRPLLDVTGKYVVLASGLDLTTARAALRTRLPGAAVPISGMVLETEQRREHPAGTIAAQVVGVTRPDGTTCTSTSGEEKPCVGVSGIEFTEDKVLSGSAGSLTEEVDPSGRVIPGGDDSTKPAIQGSDVRLTIDRDVQFAAQQALDQEVINSNSRGGHIVVMDPKSGEILAIASSPGFDASQWSGGKVDPDALTLTAVTDPYEPGSVNKVITAAAALDTGIISPDTEITVENKLKVPGRAEEISDAEDHPTEHLTFTGVLAQSSNIGTVHVAQKLGSPTLYKYLRAFGLGSTTGSGLPGESAGILHDVGSWTPSDQATIPFGQGMSATALQIASVYATIANGGVRVAPSIVRGVVGPDGTYVPAKKKAGDRVISAGAANTLSQMLESVVSADGTAPAASIPGYRIAGKTGTAQAVSGGRYDGGYVASFVGYAPADKPRLVVSVVLDHPTGGAYFGGEVAAPVFRSVMGFALQAYKIMPTNTHRPVMRLSYDSPSSSAGTP